MSLTIVNSYPFRRCSPDGCRDNRTRTGGFGLDSFLRWHKDCRHRSRLQASSIKFIVQTVSFTIDFHIMCLGLHTRESFLLRHQSMMLNNYDTQFDKYTSKCCRPNGKIVLITIQFVFHIIIYLILNSDYGIGWCVHSTWLNLWHQNGR